MKDEIIDGIRYRLDEETKTAEVIKNSEGYEGDIFIPEIVVFNKVLYRVTRVGKNAFSYCESLTSISIPNSVTCIEDRAFHDCKKLSSITIPDSVEIIGDSAFWGCESLKAITVPNGMKVIGDYAFASCTSLTSITFQGAAPWMKKIVLGDNWHFGSPAKIIIAPVEI